MLVLDNSVLISIDLTKPSSQLIGVSIQWTPSDKLQSFSIPSWTPGSYTIRDHIQYIYSVRVNQSDKPIKLNIDSVNSWSFELQNLEPLTLTYMVVANQLTVRTSYLDDEFASLCMSSIVIGIKEKRYQRHNLKVHKPDNWKIYTTLSINKYYYSNSYDDLLDSPLHLGDFYSTNFKVRGYIHEMVVIGSSPSNIRPSFIEDVADICEAACKIMNTEPPSKSKYQFILILLDNKYGGLEHDNSCVLHFSWNDFIDDSGYRKLLQLIGHEYFHQWNIRRLRPKEYKEYDYNDAVISESLWFAEGVTSYFDIIIPFLAGKCSFDDVITDFQKDINIYFNTPGRKEQSLVESSSQAWVKLYKSTKSSSNYQISYYILGSIVALCLDVQLRSKGSSLSSLTRYLWVKFGNNKVGYTRFDIIDYLNRFDPNFSILLSNWLETPNSLNIEHILDLVGIDIEEKLDDLQIGLNVSEKGGQFIIENIIPNSPAYNSELISGDQLVSIDSFQIKKLDNITKYSLNKDSIIVHYFRRSILRSTILDLKKSEKSKHFKLFLRMTSDNERKQLLNQWKKFI